MSTTVSSALRTASVLKALRKALQISTLGLGLAVTAHAASPSYYEFESGHVRPLAMSADGSRLFAVNTPNGTLDIFRINGTSLTLEARVPVGLEPVAVSQRTDNEVWVVNHLSDSVSIVSLDGTPRVTRTLLVGDEPRDVVFAGSPQRAFITTAHRGQQLDALKGTVEGANGPQLTTQPGRFDGRHARQDHELLRGHAPCADREPRQEDGVRGCPQVGQPDHRHQRRSGV
jgi:DNA-binding beta-propeller fold protein YncE